MIYILNWILEILLILYIIINYLKEEFKFYNKDKLNMK